MSDAAYTAVGSMIKDINNELQIVALIVVGVFAVIFLWLLKVAGDGKKLVAKSVELEAERTALRKAERDKQMSDMENRFASALSAQEKVTDAAMNTANGVGKSLDRHIDEHKVNDEKTQKNIVSIDERLRRIEANLIERKEFIAMCEKVNDINTGMVKMMTILEERTKKK